MEQRQTPTRTVIGPFDDPATVEVRAVDPLPVPAIAVAASVLWQRFLCLDPADPGWPDRDRFVLSSGRFGPLLDWLMDQAGVEPPAPDCAHGRHPALETEIGPPGQGFATAVGLAMGERVLAGRFGRTLVDHRTWVLACETDLAAGVSLEAAELAGRMELDKLVVLFEPSGDGQQGGRQDGPDAATRFAASGWAVRQVAANDRDAVAASIARALRNRRPTLIACLPGTSLLGSNGTSPGDTPGDEADVRSDRRLKQRLPSEITEWTAAWAASAQRGAAARRGWLKRFARHRMATEFERQMAGRLPPALRRAMPRGQDQPPSDTLAAARQDLLALCAALPETVTLHSAAGVSISAAGSVSGRSAPGTEAVSVLTGRSSAGSAGNAPVAAIGMPAGGVADRPVTGGQASGPPAPDGPASTAPFVAMQPASALVLTGGRHLACGVQEHGMAAISNGLALHGGLRPILSASVVSIDRMRPALRLAALMGRSVVYLLADQVLEGTGWPPMEQFASLRAMPHVALFRPADPVELAACWHLALNRDEGPSLLALSAGTPSDRAGPVGPRGTMRAQPAASDPSWRHDGCAQGGYVLAEARTRRHATLIATGPEVAEAMAAREMLASRGIETAVVSLPCWELFAARPASYHAQVLGSAPRIGIEAASGFGWERWLGQDGMFIGMDGFGPDRHNGLRTRRPGRDGGPPDRSIAAGPNGTGSGTAGGPAGITADRIATRVARLLGVSDVETFNEE